MKELIYKNGQDRPVTTSRIIAEKFEKQHKDVLKSIQRFDFTENFTERNFTLSEYKDSTGRKLPLYEITRDGFMILVFGFTGKKAIKWKVKFIEAFNKMEQTLLAENYNSPAQHPFLQYNDKDRADLQCLMELEIKGSDHAWAFLNAIVPFTEKTKKSSKTAESKYIPHGSHETTLIDCVLGWWKDQGKDSIKIGTERLLHILWKRPDWPVGGPKGANWLTQRLKENRELLLKHGIDFHFVKTNAERKCYFFIAEGFQTKGGCHEN